MFFSNIYANGAVVIFFLGPERLYDESVGVLIYKKIFNISAKQV